MTMDKVVAFHAPEGFSSDPLTDLLRNGARELIAQAVEAELNAFLAAQADRTDTAGRQRLVRHCHLPKRVVQTGIGAVPVKVPRVRDQASPRARAAPSRGLLANRCPLPGRACLHAREGGNGCSGKGLRTGLTPREGMHCAGLVLRSRLFRRQRILGCN